MNQTLRQEKRIKPMGMAVPGITHTVLLLGGGESQTVNTVAIHNTRLQMDTIDADEKVPHCPNKKLDIHKN